MRGDIDNSNTVQCEEVNRCYRSYFECDLVSAHFWHTIVEDHHVECACGYESECVFSGKCCQNCVPGHFQQGLLIPQDHWVVIDTQDDSLRDRAC